MKGFKEALGSAWKKGHMPEATLELGDFKVVTPPPVLDAFTDPRAWLNF